MSNERGSFCVKWVDVINFKKVEMENNNAEWQLVFWTALLTFATLLLGIVAAFQDIIRSWFKKPKLHIILALEDPVCTKQLCRAFPNSLHHQLVRQWKDPEYENELEFSTYYIRAIIRNCGNISAENVEVILSDVEIYENNNWIRKRDFPFDNLIWSSFTSKEEIKTYCEYISPKTGQYINVGHIYDPQYFRDRNYEGIFKEGYPHFYPKDTTKFLFCFDVNMRSYNQHFIIGPGKYKFKLTVGAANSSKSISKIYYLETTGNWKLKEEDFYNKEIIFREWS